MQYLMIQDSDTLSSISKIVGSQNVDSVLFENGLVRSPNIGQKWKEKCNELLDSNPPEVTGSRKISLLNSLTGSEELFEKACLMDENEWKIFSAFQSFADTLRIPETVSLPFSEKVIGDSINTIVSLNTGNAISGSSSGRDAQNKYGNKGNTGNDFVINMTTPSRTNPYFTSDASLGSYSGNNNQSSVTGTVNSSSTQTSPVSSVVYRAVIEMLKVSDTIDPGIFNTVNTSPAVGAGSNTTSNGGSTGNPISWNLPWGKIQVYSSLLDEIMDIPAYPEELEETRNASYTSMPDTIYQYEPWITYQSSGPREQSLTFHLHRDMWSGNHLDGKANELIRFCQANTFPRYSGSAVLSPTFRVYIDGKTFVSGVLTNTNVRWMGPIGQDNWYLEFELSLSIQEVSEVALNIDTVRNFGLIGG